MSDPTAPEPLWSVLVPVKRLHEAKTRLAVDDRLRTRLALAFARDTLAALGRSRNVGSIFVLTSDPVARAALRRPDVHFLDDHGGGLNRAIDAALPQVRYLSGTGRLAIVMADLPALRPDEFRRAGAAASLCARSFVADADQLGTTAVFFSGGSIDRPRFGSDSRLAHARSGAIALELGQLDGLRRDIDRLDHLHAAAGLGLGDHTRAVLATESLLAPRPVRPVA